MCFLDFLVFFFFFFSPSTEDDDELEYEEGPGDVEGEEEGTQAFFLEPVWRGVHPLFQMAPHWQPLAMPSDARPLVSLRPKLNLAKLLYSVKQLQQKRKAVSQTE